MARQSFLLLFAGVRAAADDPPPGKAFLRNSALRSRPAERGICKLDGRSLKRVVFTGSGKKYVRGELWEERTWIHRFIEVLNRFIFGFTYMVLMNIVMI